MQSFAGNANNASQNLWDRQSRLEGERRRMMREEGEPLWGKEAYKLEQNRRMKQKEYADSIRQQLSKSGKPSNQETHSTLPAIDKSDENRQVLQNISQQSNAQSFKANQRRAPSSQVTGNGNIIAHAGWQELDPRNSSAVQNVTRAMPPAGMPSSGAPNAKQPHRKAVVPPSVPETTSSTLHTSQPVWAQNDNGSSAFRTNQDDRMAYVLHRLQLLENTSSQDAQTIKTLHIRLEQVESELIASKAKAHQPEEFESQAGEILAQLRVREVQENEKREEDMALKASLRTEISTLERNLQDAVLQWNGYQQQTTQVIDALNKRENQREQMFIDKQVQALGQIHQLEQHLRSTDNKSDAILQRMEELEEQRAEHVRHSIRNETELRTRVERLKENMTNIESGIMEKLIEVREEGFKTNSNRNGNSDAQFKFGEQHIQAIQSTLLQRCTELESSIALERENRVEMEARTSKLLSLRCEAVEKNMQRELSKHSRQHEYVRDNTQNELRNASKELSQLGEQLSKRCDRAIEISKQCVGECQESTTRCESLLHDKIGDLERIVQAEIKMRMSEVEKLDDRIESQRHSLQHIAGQHTSKQTAKLESMQTQLNAMKRKLDVFVNVNGFDFDDNTSSPKQSDNVAKVIAMGANPADTAASPTNTIKGLNERPVRPRLLGSREKLDSISKQVMDIEQQLKHLSERTENKVAEAETRTQQVVSESIDKVRNEFEMLVNERIQEIDQQNEAALTKTHHATLEHVRNSLEIEAKSRTSDFESLRNQCEDIDNRLNVDIPEMLRRETEQLEDKLRAKIQSESEATSTATHALVKQHLDSAMSIIDARLGESIGAIESDLIQTREQTQQIEKTVMDHTGQVTCDIQQQSQRFNDMLQVFSIQADTKWGQLNERLEGVEVNLSSLEFEAEREKFKELVDETVLAFKHSTATQDEKMELEVTRLKKAFQSISSQNFDRLSLLIEQKVSALRSLNKASLQAENNSRVSSENKLKTVIEERQESDKAMMLELIDTVTGQIRSEFTVALNKEIVQRIESVKNSVNMIKKDQQEERDAQQIEMAMERLCNFVVSSETLRNHVEVKDTIWNQARDFQAQLNQMHDSTKTSIANESTERAEQMQALRHVVDKGLKIEAEERESQAQLLRAERTQELQTQSVLDWCINQVCSEQTVVKLREQNDTIQLALRNEVEQRQMESMDAAEKSLDLEMRLGESMETIEASVQQVDQRLSSAEEGLKSQIQEQASNIEQVKEQLLSDVLKSEEGVTELIESVSAEVKGIIQSIEAEKLETKSTTESLEVSVKEIKESSEQQFSSMVNKLESIETQVTESDEKIDALKAQMLDDIVKSEKEIGSLIEAISQRTSTLEHTSESNLQKLKSDLLEDIVKSEQGIGELVGAVSERTKVLEDKLVTQSQQVDKLNEDFRESRTSFAGTLKPLPKEQVTKSATPVPEKERPVESTTPVPENEQVTESETPVEKSVSTQDQEPDSTEPVREDITSEPDKKIENEAQG